MNSLIRRDDSHGQSCPDEELCGMTFEQAVKELEEIVQKLEEGKAPLEEALRLFERGAKLAKFCEHKLEWVEKRLQMVVRTPDGRIELRDIEVAEEVTQEREAKLAPNEVSGEFLPTTDEDEGLPI